MPCGDSYNPLQQTYLQCKKLSLFILTGNQNGIGVPRPRLPNFVRNLRSDYGYIFIVQLFHNFNTNFHPPAHPNPSLHYLSSSWLQILLILTYLEDAKLEQTTLLWSFPTTEVLAGTLRIGVPFGAATLLKRNRGMKISDKAHAMHSDGIEYRDILSLLNWLYSEKIYITRTNCL